MGSPRLLFLQLQRVSRSACTPAPSLQPPRCGALHRAAIRPAGTPAPQRGKRARERVSKRTCVTIHTCLYVRARAREKCPGLHVWGQSFVSSQAAPQLPMRPLQPPALSICRSSGAWMQLPRGIRGDRCLTLGLLRDGEGAAGSGMSQIWGGRGGIGGRSAGRFTAGRSLCWQLLSLVQYPHRNPETEKRMRSCLNWAQKAAAES